MFSRPFLVSVALWVSFAGFLRVAVVPPESCGLTDAASLDAAARGAADWIMRNQHPDGSYTYLYLVNDDTIPDEYNIVRHAGVTMSLYQAAGHYVDDRMMDAGDAGLEWLRGHLVTRHGWSAPVLGNENPSLGAAALMTIGLAERRLVTGGRQYDELMRELGRFMFALQREDGSFAVSWDLQADVATPGLTSRYYPGEALWALALLEEAFPDEGWDTAAWRDLDFLVTTRDEQEDIAFPPLPDQWLSYGLAEMADWHLEGRHLEHSRRLAARFGLLVRTEAQRQAGWLGRLVRGREARSAGLGTWVEGLGSLWRLSAVDPRFSDLSAKLRERLVCSAGILAARQADAQSATGNRSVDLVDGAWFTRGETRMDDQQHALSGLLYTINALEGTVQWTSDRPVLPRP